MLTKVCAKCRVHKDIREFSRLQASKDGRHSYCKICAATVLKAWIKANPERYRAAVRKGVKRHYQTHKAARLAAGVRWKKSKPGWKIRDAVQAALHYAIKRNARSGKWFNVLGYTAAEFRAHLEARFKPGMRWSNYGEWQIDHIIPQSKFSYSMTTDPDFHKCWALSNLQPLWKAENLRKSHFVSPDTVISGPA